MGETRVPVARGLGRGGEALPDCHRGGSSGHLPRECLVGHLQADRGSTIKPEAGALLLYPNISRGPAVH